MKKQVQQMDIKQLPAPECVSCYVVGVRRALDYLSLGNAKALREISNCNDYKDNYKYDAYAHLGNTRARLLSESLFIDYLMKMMDKQETSPCVCFFWKERERQMTKARSERSKHAMAKRREVKCPAK